MKKYELVRTFIIAGATSLILTSCSGLVYNAVYNKSVNKYNKINDSTDDKYVIVVNNEVKIVEKLGKNSYKDIITGDIYNTSEVLEVKGTLNKILSFEEIMEIENNAYFDDADWTKVYENIRNKYQASWCNDIKYKDRHLEIDEFSSDELSEFFYEYNSLIPSDDLYILDTYLCEIENTNELKLDRYYLFTKNYNPINNNLELDSARLLFNNNSYLWVLHNDNDFLIDLGNGIKFRSKSNIPREGRQAVFKINDFYKREGFVGRKDSYTILELEKLMKRINKEEVDKIDSSRIYVFDASVSDIDILPLNQNNDVSSLEIDNYYILIQDENISNKFNTLSNNNDKLLKSDIYVDSNSRLISSTSSLGFTTDVDTSYNLMSINDFLMVKGLGNYINETYSIGELNKLDWSLNKIELNKIGMKLREIVYTKK